jgi:hypothetical protein
MRYAACMRDIKTVYKMSVRKPDRKKPIEWPRLEYENTIKIDLEVIIPPRSNCCLYRRSFIGRHFLRYISLHVSA